MRLTQRLTRLERTVAPQMRVLSKRRQYVEEGERRRQAAWEYMYPTMSEEHAAMVVDAYARGLAYSDHEEHHTPAGRLLKRCLNAMYPATHWPYNEIPPEVQFAMPPVVAEVYMANDDALPLHNCEDCGYKLPHGYFDACPLCGGRIGWYAYYSRRKAEQEPQ